MELVRTACQAVPPPLLAGWSRAYAYAQTVFLLSTTSAAHFTSISHTWSAAGGLTPIGAFDILSPVAARLRRVRDPMFGGQAF